MGSSLGYVRPERSGMVRCENYEGRPGAPQAAFIGTNGEMAASFTRATTRSLTAQSKPCRSIPAQRPQRNEDQRVYRAGMIRRPSPGPSRLLRRLWLLAKT